MLAQITGEKVEAALSVSRYAMARVRRIVHPAFHLSRELKNIST
jgi:hypothetical protein